MKKINENKFWQEFISEFYTQDQVNQESYSCLNAVLECPEIIEMFPEAPLIRRPGQINAWDNEEFVAAVKKTGKKQLIIAGIVTDVCVAFAALSAVEAGYEVFVVTDASGTFNAEVRDAAWRRMEAAGVQLVNFFSVACELHRDWRNDMEGLAALLGKYIPAYQNIMTSFSAK